MIEVTDATFDAEVLQANVPVLVDFGATWCGPCRALVPVLEGIAAESAGKLKVVKVDIDACPLVSARYGIRAAPTILVFRDGQKRAQHVGLTTKQKLLALVSQFRQNELFVPS